MQANTQRRAAGLKDKIPDIQKTLETVRFLKSRQADAEPLETTFELNDTLFAKAEVPPTDEVYLWLGANVMLSYSLPEAVELLSSKLSTAKASLITCEEDLEFLREQITVGCVIALGGHLLTGLDARGCICSRVQLGRCAAQERQGGGRLNRRQEGPLAERLGGWLELLWARRKHVYADRKQFNMRLQDEGLCGVAGAYETKGFVMLRCLLRQRRVRCPSTSLPERRSRAIAPDLQQASRCEERL
jgi:prefoldin subunit 5